MPGADLIVKNGNLSDIEVAAELSELREKVARLERLQDEHKNLIKKLQESEERFRVLFEEAPEAIVLFDAEADRFVDANAKAEQLFGCTREKLLMSGPQTFYLKNQPDGLPVRESVRAYTARVLSGERVVFERAIRNSAGKDLLCEVQLVRFPSLGRKLVRAIFTDISELKRSEEAIRRGEERLRRAQTIAHVGNWELDLRTKRIWASEEAFRIYGVDREASDVPLEFVQGCVLPQYRPKLDLALEHLIKQGKEYDEEFEIRRQKDGQIRFIHSRAELVFDGDGQPAQVVGVLQDITDRKQAEGSLRESEEKYRMVAEQTHDGICIYKQDRFIFVNNRMSEITGYSKEELRTNPVRKFIHPDDSDYVMDIGGKRERGEAAPSTYEARIVTRDGVVRYVELAVSSILYGGGYAALGALRDITDRKEAENALQANLHEKEILLREIHHRVKNNLQVMSSLLNLQSQHILDPRDVDAFRASMDRIKSMALIHDKLYRSQNLATVYLPDYVDDLSRGLVQTYALGKMVELRTDIAPIVLDIDTATHLGLMINELLSNSLKHAFPGNLDGNITIGIREDGKGIEILVSDNGIGFPEDLDFMNTTSLGMQLVVTLVEQLEGTISLAREDGTAFRVVFERGS